MHVSEWCMTCSITLRSTSRENYLCTVPIANMPITGSATCTQMKSHRSWARPLGKPWLNCACLWFRSSFTARYLVLCLHQQTGPLYILGLSLNKTLSYDNNTLKLSNSKNVGRLAAPEGNIFHSGSITWQCAVTYYSVHLSYQCRQH